MTASAGVASVGPPEGHVFAATGTLAAGVSVSGVGTVVGSAVMGYLAGQIIAYPVAPEPGYHVSREHDPVVGGLEGALVLALVAARVFKL
jgi:hypothetical protein